MQKLEGDKRGGVQKFLVVWENELDKNVILTRDRAIPQRFTDPASPMTFALIKSILGPGWKSVMRELPIPQFKHSLEFRLFNSYLYWNIDFEAKIKPSLRLLRFIVGLFRSVYTGVDRWENMLPLYLKKVHDLELFDIENASLEDLWQYFNKVCELEKEYYFWQAYIGMTGDIFYDVFVDIMVRFYGISKSEVGRLIQGIPNKTLEMMSKLQELIEIAKETDVICKELQKDSINNALSVFQERKECSEFVDKFNEFILEFGHRSTKIDWFYPTLGEDPNSILNIIKHRIMLKDPYFNRENIDQKREETIRIIYERFRYKPMRLILFKHLLKLVQKWSGPAEDRQHYFKYTDKLLRNTLLEFGSRFVDIGIFKAKDDIFFLTSEEVLDIIEMVKKGETPQIYDTIHERRKYWERNFKLTPLHRINGAISVETNLTITTPITGIPASSGMVTGKARIIYLPSEFHKFKEGEILVTRTTNPAWVPLFNLAKGIVTDYGGALSHCAILAREFNIPAVVGTEYATRIIKNGQPITIDGDYGVVYIDTTNKH